MMTYRKSRLSQLTAIWYITIIGAIFIAVAACGDGAGTDVTDDQAAITEMSKARAQAFSAGDAAGIAMHFTADAYLMAPDKPICQGRNAVQSYYQAIFDEYRTKLESHYEEVVVSGNLAYGRGVAKVTLYPISGGDSVVSTAKYLNILKKQADGSWKTTHDVWNSD